MIHFFVSLIRISVRTSFGKPLGGFLLIILLPHSYAQVWEVSGELYAKRYAMYGQPARAPVTRNFSIIRSNCNIFIHLDPSESEQGVGYSEFSFDGVDSYLFGKFSPRTNALLEHPMPPSTVKPGKGLKKPLNDAEVEVRHSPTPPLLDRKSVV